MGRSYVSRLHRVVSPRFNIYGGLVTRRPLILATRRWGPPNFGTTKVRETGIAVRFDFSRGTLEHEQHAKYYTGLFII